MSTLPTVVHTTPIRDDSKSLTVSTVELGCRNYETVIFDDHDDKRHSHHQVGEYVVDVTVVRDAARDDAMATHRRMCDVAYGNAIRRAL